MISIALNYAYKTHLDPILTYYIDISDNLYEVVTLLKLCCPFH